MGFFPGILKASYLFTLTPIAHVGSYSTCVARSGDMAGYLGAREPAGGKQAMKAVPVNYLAHLRDFFDPLIICACVDLFYQSERA